MGKKYALLKKILNDGNTGILLSSDTTKSCCENSIGSSHSCFDYICKNEKDKSEEDSSSLTSISNDNFPSNLSYGERKKNKKDDLFHKSNIFFRNPNLENKENDFKHRKCTSREKHTMNKKRKEEIYFKQMTNNIEKYIKKMSYVYYPNDRNGKHKVGEKKRRGKKCHNGCESMNDAKFGNLSSGSLSDSFGSLGFELAREETSYGEVIPSRETTEWSRQLDTMDFPCVLCSKMPLVEKIKKLLFNKIKPLCASCFYVFLNLVGFNSTVCISCFGLYFPYKNLTKCVICSNFDTEQYSHSNNPSELMEATKNELNIFMSLYKYHFSCNLNSDLFLNFFININYCFNHLYFYFKDKQTLVISKNCVHASYIIPFSELVHNLQLKTKMARKKKNISSQSKEQKGGCLTGCKINFFKRDNPLGNVYSGDRDEEEDEEVDGEQEKINEREIDDEEIVDGEIDDEEINEGEIDDEEIDDEEIDDEEIDDEEIVDGEIDDEEIDDEEIVDGEIDNKEIDDEEIVDGEIDNEEIDDEEISDGEIDDEEIADGEIDDEEIADGEIDDEEIADGEIDDEEEVDKDGNWEGISNRGKKSILYVQREKNPDEVSPIGGNTSGDARALLLNKIIMPFERNKGLIYKQHFFLDHTDKEEGLEMFPYMGSVRERQVIEVQSMEKTEGNHQKSPVEKTQQHGEEDLCGPTRENQCAKKEGGKKEKTGKDGDESDVVEDQFCWNSPGRSDQQREDIEMVPEEKTHKGEVNSRGEEEVKMEVEEVKVEAKELMVKVLEMKPEVEEVKMEEEEVKVKGVDTKPEGEEVEIKKEDKKPQERERNAEDKLSEQVVIKKETEVKAEVVETILFEQKSDESGSAIDEKLPLSEKNECIDIMKRDIVKIEKCKICKRENTSMCSHKNGELSFDEFSESIIRSLLRLKNEKVQSSFHQLKIPPIKLNKINFNKTVKKYHSKGDLLLYYVKYVQRQERDADRLFQKLQDTKQDVENFQRRFKLHYGKEASQTDVNRSILAKSKQLSRMQILLENRINNFENIPNVREVYKIIDEFSELLQLSLSGRNYEKRKITIIKQYLKGISTLRDRRVISRKDKKGNDLLILEEKYKHFHNDLSSLVNILTLLRNMFDVSNWETSKFDSFHVLKEIKFLLYDRGIKKLRDKLKKVFPKGGYYLSARRGIDRGKNSTRSGEYLRFTHSEGNVPQLVCLLNVKKRNLDTLINSDKVEIVSKNELTFLKESYFFDSIFVNNIYAYGFMSNVIEKYINHFANQNNVVLFNFSLHYAKSKKVFFLNCFRDNFSLDKAKGKREKRGTKQGTAKGGKKGSENNIKICSKHGEYSDNGEKGTTTQGGCTCCCSGGSGYAGCSSTAGDELCRNFDSPKDEQKDYYHRRRMKKTVFIKIIRELKKKLNEVYSHNNYKLTLNTYAQKGKRLYNIGKCIFRDSANASPEGDIRKDKIKMRFTNTDGHMHEDVREDEHHKLNKKWKERGGNTHKGKNTTSYLHCIDLKRIKNVYKCINYKNMNKFKKYSLIFLIKLELYLPHRDITLQTFQKKKGKKVIFHFSLVDINVPIFDVMKRKESTVNYFIEFKNRTNFENIFINYIQSRFFNATIDDPSSQNIVKFLFRKNSRTCFILYINDDFLFGDYFNRSIHDYTSKECKMDDEIMIGTTKKENKRNINKQTILQLLYIYYWCTACEGFTLNS
ncbi:conserved Plasmodium protein, unknown function [Plasmodium ovale curtisi]|uniref:Uncharacterized protein n=1 Tax=Plasmodium ovale curtisi TaxID=864141 RepID=A0A1A8WWZ9_PLAOA|nr:conserved Plasmodium protein, unknown function [Plasmodium ovale curtisi]